jgi:hypothetical protein
MSFLNDLFDEASTTALDAHTPNPGPGGTWAAMQTVSGGSINPMRIPAGAGYAEAQSGTAYWRNSATPPTADYSVEGVIQRSGFGGGANGVLGRFTGQGTHYRLELNEYANQLRLILLNAWSSSVLGTYAWSPSDGTYTIRLEMIGSAIKGYLGGVERISVTDTAISAAGLAGISLEGHRMLSIDAVNLGTAPSALLKIMQMLN